MRKGRKYIDKLVDLQEKLRIELLVVYCTFDFSKLDLCLLKEDKIITVLKEIEDLVKDSKDAVFFTHYRYLVTATFQLIKWARTTLSASPDAGTLMQAAKVNASLIDLSAFPYANSFAASCSAVIAKIAALDGDVLKLRGVFDELKKIPYPFLYEIEEHPYFNFRKNRIAVENAAVTEIEETPIVSIEFLVDQEPWANPQILQPGKIYTLSGKIRVNAWPKGFDELILHPISSVDQTNYILDLPLVKPFQEKTLNISGTVTFKYPQHKFDDNLSVRLLCYFQNAAGARKIPLVIGYDQLIAKVLDPNSYEFMTGFASMSSALLDVATKLSTDFPMVESKERDAFLTLLRGILNYQGYCLQQGVYKNETNLAESIFRDRMIQHLIGLPYLGESIVKEAELAGGRVEISYNGVIAELKSESRIADRKQLVVKYGSQPVAYSSGNSKQLSILCILDLTEKIAPPAPPRNNIIVHMPEVHGHDVGELAFPPLQIVVIIDGNTKKPSDYSKN